MRRRRQRSPDPQIDPRHFPRIVAQDPDPAQPVHPPPVHPEDGELHPFLRFDREEDRSDLEYLQRKADGHGFQPLRYIVWESLGAVALQSRAVATCGPHWQRLFSISRSVYHELALEFFATFHLITPLTDYEREDALTFRLAGAERRLSLRQFAVLMGLYQQEELDTPAFTEAITDWPEGVTPISFWPEIGLGQYTSPTVPKSSKLRDPLHRVLHRAIVHSLTARGESPGSITHSDLFYLYTMVHAVPCQLALCLARFLFSIRTSRVTQGIYGGGYVTHLALAMDLVPPEVAEGLTFSAQAEKIDMAVLVRMRVAGMIGRRMRLLGPDGRQWMPPRAEGEPEPRPEGDGAGDGGEEREHARPELHHHERRDSPPREQQQQHQTGPIVYTRDYRARFGVIERSIAELRDTQRQQHAELRELQRLEFAHAEAHRQYLSSMLQILVADSLSASTVPEPPVPPQRLRDFYDEAGPSHSHQPPPP